MFIYRKEKIMGTKPPETLTDEECSLLLTGVLARPRTLKNHQRSTRDTLMILLMLDAGLRDGELVQLIVSDLVICDEPVSALRIRAEISKSKLDRTVPITIRTTRAIKACHQRLWTQIGISTGDFAFPSKSRSGHLTTIQINRIIKAAAAKSIHRDIHPHVLRHTYATRLMRTTNARIVQQLLGHKRISSTQIYMHPGAEDLRKAVDGIE